MLLLTRLQQKDVIIHLVSFVLRPPQAYTGVCVFHDDDDYALFVSLRVHLLLSLCNLCVVAGAGADKPRDGI